MSYLDVVVTRVLRLPLDEAEVPDRFRGRPVQHLLQPHVPGVQLVDGVPRTDQQVVAGHQHRREVVRDRGVAVEHLQEGRWC